VLFTGGWYDRETGLYQMHWRTYNPANGQWLSEDPIGFGGRDVNWRRYVGNSPTNGVDRNGLFGFPMMLGIAANVVAKQTPAYWKALAAQRVDISASIPKQLKDESMTQGILRNYRITAAYAELASKDIDSAVIYIWMGAAAFASSDVGKAMREARDSYKDADKAGNNLLKAFYNQQFEYLSIGNKAVYEDLYWQHLAFASGGIALMNKFAASWAITADHLNGWRLIDSGITKVKKGKVANGQRDMYLGNVLLFTYEQQKILQAKVFTPARVDLILATRVPLLGAPAQVYLNSLNAGLKSLNAKAGTPFGGPSFADWAKNEKIARPNILEFNQRYKWGVEVFLQSYVDRLVNEQNDFLKLFRVFLNTEAEQCNKR
jgi:RHS repeat-associated protein